MSLTKISKFELAEQFAGMPGELRKTREHICKMLSDHGFDLSKAMQITPNEDQGVIFFYQNPAIQKLNKKRKRK